ncbi:MAG TPA: hypothetical protein VLF93_05185 [Candidatus Saccharimonadales bacterium]|nr:hypothetical protein [Candidatus Saccharimonadales bacterium]
MQTFSATPTSSSITPLHKKHHFILIFLLVLAALSLTTTVFLLIKPQNPSSSSLSSNAIQKTLISGSFDINGVIPQGASIVIKRVNASSTTDNATYPQNFPAVDQGTWSLDDITSGNSYVLTADVVVNNKVIATSAPLEVTAPADDETLIFNIPTTNPTGTAMITGDIRVDGYIPAGSTIKVQGRVLGKKTYTTVASNLPGAESQFMSYASAIAGEQYEIVGILLDKSGNQIGISPTLDVTAPALNEQLTINSKAIPSASPTPTPTNAPLATAAPTPVPTPTMISGSIDFNGVAPANSRIVILEKVYNSQNYQVAVNNVTPQDNATWQWTGPSTGTWYDIVAVLKQTQPDGTDQDIATSQSQSIAAPGTNVVLTVNSGIVLSPPSGTITASCGNLSGSTWGGQLSYPSVQGAQSYWLEVGTASGSNDVYNAFQNTNNQPNQTASVNFNNGITYYAQYAYAQTLNATQPQFSPFSSPMQFKCSN